MRVVNYLRENRQKKGMTQVELAEKLQVTRQTIIAIEQNKYNPSLPLALKIVYYFDVPIDQLFILEEDENEQNK